MLKPCAKATAAPFLRFACNFRVHKYQPLFRQVKAPSQRRLLSQRQQYPITLWPEFTAFDHELPSLRRKPTGDC